MKLKSILLFASAMIVTAGAYAQGTIAYVTSGADKYVLVEEATGTWCPFCPDGYQDLEQSCKTIPKVIAASWHGPQACNGPEIMKIPFYPLGNPYTCSSNGPGWITGFPKGTVDRALIGGTVGQNRPFSTKVPSRISLAPNFKVSMLCKFDTAAASRKLTVKITVKCLVASTGEYRTGLLVTEDSISSATPGYAQYSNQSSATTACNGQPSWWTGLGSPISPASKYWHNSVVRSIVDSFTSQYGDTATTLWGTKLFTNPAVGDSVSKTFEWKIPATYNKNKMHVIGMCTKYGSTTNDRAVENSIEAAIKDMPLVWPATPPTAMDMVAIPIQDVELYPNPAKTTVTVRGMLQNPSDVKVTVFNAIGQKVLTNEYKASGSLFSERMSIADLSNGVYFMNIDSDGGSVTKQFTVNR